MMLDSPMIDVAIGLVFFYVTLSLVCSSIQEIIASVLGLRSRNLRRVRAGAVRPPADQGAAQAEAAAVIRQSGDLRRCVDRGRGP